MHFEFNDAFCFTYLDNAMHPCFADLYWFLQILCLDIVTVGKNSKDIMYALLKISVNTLTKSKQNPDEKLCSSREVLCVSLWFNSLVCFRMRPAWSQVSCPIYHSKHTHTPDICVSDSLLTLFVLHGVCHDLDSCCRHTHAHTLEVVIGCYFYRFKWGHPVPTFSGSLRTLS